MDIDTITVGELADRLALFDRDTPVVASYGYGDLGDTPVVLELQKMSLEDVRSTCYGKSGLAVARDEDDDALPLQVLVLSTKNGS